MTIRDFGHKSFIGATGLKERIQEAEKENQMSREIKFRAWDTKRKKMFSAEEMRQGNLHQNPELMEQNNGE